MINHRHLRELIIRPALDHLGLYSLDREELLVITAAQESLGGTYLMQNDSRGYPKGPALGIYQMEPATYNDLWANFLAYKNVFIRKLTEGQGGPPYLTPFATQMIYDLRYATMIACLQYYRFKEPIPQDLDGQIRYYKKYWNTELGKATLAETKKNYERYVK